MCGCCRCAIALRSCCHASLGPLLGSNMHCTASYTQNPTSTAIFKSLLTLKTRNALVRLLGLSLLALLPAALYVCHLGGLPVKASSCSHAWRLRLGLPALPLTATGLTPAQVLCPHPRAKKCTIEAARIVRDAAVAAGAPEGEGRCGRLCFGTGASFHNSWP